jgi:hypothetical protein
MKQRAMDQDHRRQNHFHSSAMPNPKTKLRPGHRSRSPTLSSPRKGGFAAFAVACVVSGAIHPARGAQSMAPAGGDAIPLPDLVVRGREDSMIGIAEAASQGTVGAVQLEQRTLSRTGEVLETVPGLIVTQHSGAGKANQFFLRGFNLDHGTDFATSIDGVRVNLPSHGHGQGYTDLNFIIPELIERVVFRKGPYYADTGDFSSAGSADLQYFRELDRSLAQVEAGSFGYVRGLYLSSPRVGAGHLLHGLELYRNDGPWEHPDNYKRINAVARYAHGDDALGWSVTAMAYAGDWDATDQIARRALEQPGFDRFDSLNTSSGGDSQRYSLSAEWHRANERSASRVMAYGLYYDLSLFSDFTYILGSPQGDQFEQRDERWVGGMAASHAWFGQLFERPMQNTAGLQLRSDSIENGLFQTVNRQRTDKTDYAGDPIPGVTRRDDIWETAVSPYLENKVEWTPWFRSTVGLRADFYHFDVEGGRDIDSGSENDVIVSPRGSLVFGPWENTEIYLSGGLGFHSNDARGVTSADNPGDPLVRTYGAEVGVRTTALPGLHSTIALWWLDIDSELVFVGDAGSTEASRPSRRYGLELANYYTPVSWLTVDLDLSVSHAEFRDDAPEGDHIPGSIETAIAAGITANQSGERGFFGGLRLRYFGPRPLIEDDSVRSSETILLSAMVGYRLNRTWSIAAEVFNLLDREESEIDYYYPSRLPGEPAGPDEGGYQDIHFHPVEPIHARIALSARF